MPRKIRYLKPKTITQFLNREMAEICHFPRKTSQRSSTTAVFKGKC